MRWPDIVQLLGVAVIAAVAIAGLLPWSVAANLFVIWTFGWQLATSALGRFRRRRS